MDTPVEADNPVLEDHRRAQDAFAGVLAGVGPDHLSEPTPCAEWAVRDLIDHVIGGNRWVAGQSSPSPADATGLDDDHATAARAAHDVFAAPGGLSREFELPFATLPGSAYIGMRTTDVFVHAWDLARATGQSTDLDPELAARLLEQSRQLVRPQFRGPGRPFGEEQPAPEGANPADQLAAFLGRAAG